MKVGVIIRFLQGQGSFPRLWPLVCGMETLLEKSWPLLSALKFKVACVFWNKPMESLYYKYSGAPWQSVISQYIWGSHTHLFISAQGCHLWKGLSSGHAVVCFIVRKCLHSTPCFFPGMISICCLFTRQLALSCLWCAVDITNSLTVCFKRQIALLKKASIF